MNVNQPFCGSDNSSSSSSSPPFSGSSQERLFGASLILVSKHTTMWNLFWVAGESSLWLTHEYINLTVVVENSTFTGLKKVLSGSTGQAEFLAGKVTFTYMYPQKFAKWVRV